MRVLDELCDMLEDELKQITKKDDLTPQELENAYKSVDIIKDIETIKAMKESGYSNNMSYDDYSGRYMGRGGYARDYSGRDNYDDYSRGDSYARRGRDGDGDGRYNESRDRGYSRHDEQGQLMQKMEELQRKIDKMS